MKWVVRLDDEQTINHTLAILVANVGHEKIHYQDRGQD